MKHLSFFCRSAGLVLCLLLGITSAMASDDKGLDNSISIKPASIAPGSTAQLAIELTNETAFTCFEFDIMLPEGISVVCEDDIYAVSLSDRSTKSHTINGNYQPSGEFKVIAYSGSNLNFTGSTGTICYLTLQADANMELGDYAVATVNDVKFSAYVNEAAQGHVLEATTGTITVEKGIEVEDYQFYARPVTVEEGAKTATLSVSLNN